MEKQNTTWKNFKFSDPILSEKTNPTILAFSSYFHDSSACILVNGKIVAAVDEERFTRKKHDSNFPTNAINYCLQIASLASVDYVVFYENPDVKWARIKASLKKNPPPKEICEEIHFLWKEVKSKEKIQEKFLSETGIKKDIIFLDHHLSHASSSYYMSGFEEAAVITIDGVGEKATTTYGTGKGNHLQIDKCINFPHSIGLLYTAITTFLGFKANDHEYKVMGLAPYGIMNKDKNPYYGKLKKLINFYEDGSFSLNMCYFGHEKFGAPTYTSKMIELLEVQPNSREGKITKDYENIAAALQMITEESVISLFNYVYRKTGLKNVCFSGGVALNSVLNGKLLSNTPFEKIFIQPSAGDSGTVIGCAKYIQHLVDKSSPKEHMKHSALGPEYTSEDIRDFLDQNNIIYKEYDSEDELLNRIARLLKEKSVIGWFQSRMEWGPRALGNRSILASPIGAEMRDILNLKVKHRELFRPFAPVVCIEDASEIFEVDNPIPEPTDFMLMVYPIKLEKQMLIPAVTHIDGSGRIQTIRKEQNPRYHSLIKKFGQLTGVPVLINTSFNIRGEPIVCTPRDAYRCMMGTEIDYLVLDRFTIKRSENLKDCWEPTIND